MKDTLKSRADIVGDAITGLLEAVIYVEQEILCATGYTEDSAEDVVLYLISKVETIRDLAELIRPEVTVRFYMGSSFLEMPSEELCTMSIQQWVTKFHSSGHYYEPHESVVEAQDLARYLALIPDEYR